MRDKIPKRFLQMMAGRFSILGDATRLAIIHRLMKSGEQGVSELVEATGQTHQNVSKHLRILREAGMVARRKEGLHAFYRIDDPLVEKLCQLVCESLLEEFNPRQEEKDACEDDG